MHCQKCWVNDAGAMRTTPQCVHHWPKWAMPLDSHHVAETVWNGVGHSFGWLWNGLGTASASLSVVFSAVVGKTSRWLLLFRHSACSDGEFVTAGLTGKQNDRICSNFKYLRVKWLKIQKHWRWKSPAMGHIHRYSYIMIFIKWFDLCCYLMQCYFRINYNRLKRMNRGNVIESFYI